MTVGAAGACNVVAEVDPRPRRRSHRADAVLPRVPVLHREPRRHAWCRSRPTTSFLPDVGPHRRGHHAAHQGHHPQLAQQSHRRASIRRACCAIWTRCSSVDHPSLVHQRRALPAAGLRRPRARPRWPPLIARTLICRLLVEGAWRCRASASATWRSRRGSRTWPRCATPAPSPTASSASSTRRPSGSGWWPRPPKRRWTSAAYQDKRDLLCDALARMGYEVAEARGRLLRLSQDAHPRRCRVHPRPARGRRPGGSGLRLRPRRLHPPVAHRAARDDRGQPAGIRTGVGRRARLSGAGCAGDPGSLDRSVEAAGRSACATRTAGPLPSFSMDFLSFWCNLYEVTPIPGAGLRQGAS